MPKKAAVLTVAFAAALLAIGSYRWLDARGQEKAQEDIEWLPAVLKAKPREPKAGDSELRKLMIARYNFALAENRKRFLSEVVFSDFAVQAQLGVKRLFDAELALAENPNDRVTACANFLELAKFVEKGFATFAAGRRSDPGIPDSCKFMRADAEIQLLDAKRRAAMK